jgi:lipopolysaccharide export system protein LptA
VIKIRKILLALALLCGAQAATAQGTTIGLSGAAYDGGQPVEVTADSLTVDQNSATAVFEGNARVTQGSLQLSAGTIRVDYQPDGAGISQVAAEGGVTFTNGAEIAEADSALYVLGAAEITMTGNVLLLQGQNTISGDRLTLDLNAGAGTMQGNVKTVFTPGAGK